MTALEKHIVPLQKEDLKLAFNIQSHDTVKYNPINIGLELNRAINQAITISDSKDIERTNGNIPERYLLRRFEMQGFLPASEKWYLNPVIDATLFKGFVHMDKLMYVYLGKIDTINEIQTYLDDINIVIHRTMVKYRELKKEIKATKYELAKIKKLKVGKFALNKQLVDEIIFDEITSIKGDKDSLEESLNEYLKIEKSMSNIYIGMIINPGLDLSEFTRNAEDIISKNEMFEFTYSKDNEIIFGKIKVDLHLSIPQ